METTHAFVLVYAKDGVIKVLSTSEAKQRHDTLIKDGWQHTETLDACIFIQYLHNECKTIAKEVRSLSKLK